MPRAYDASRRTEQARQTRRRILDAAVEMHRRGISAFEPLAEAAGVSVPTVRKYFPHKEAMFEGCTAHFFETFRLPDFTAAVHAALDERIVLVGAEMCRVHEETHDLMWAGFVGAPSSPALAGALAAFAGLVDGATDVLTGGLEPDAAEAARPRVRALLDTLTYRAFRVQAGLDPDATCRELTALIASALDTHAPE